MLDPLGVNNASGRSLITSNTLLKQAGLKLEPGNSPHTHTHATRERERERGTSDALVCEQYWVYSVLWFLCKHVVGIQPVTLKCARVLDALAFPIKIKDVVSFMARISSMPPSFVISALQGGL